ncbi:hypothetical protein [Paenibacillus sp. Z6-24]
MIIKKQQPATAILNEQAKILSQITNKTLQCSIDNIPPSFFSEKRIDELPFTFSFKIGSSYLKNYKFELLKFYHDILLYPVSIKLDKLVLQEILNDYPKDAFIKKIKMKK